MIKKALVTFEVEIESFEQELQKPRKKPDGEMQTHITEDENMKKACETLAMQFCVKNRLKMKSDMFNYHALIGGKVVLKDG